MFPLRHPKSFEVLRFPVVVDPGNARIQRLLMAAVRGQTTCKTISRKGNSPVIFTKHLMTATIIASVIAIASAITYSAPDCGPIAHVKFDWSNGRLVCAVHAFDQDIAIER
jgi:hypothetical protein